ncbi:MAG TPA: hypothetical protein VMB72_09765 [Acidimicrobiales bacterium]|nr:hypothetical protein [Acidimicrobiales bacterium]
MLTQAFIDGDFVDARSGETFDTFAPGSGEVLAKVAACDEADVDRAVAAAPEVTGGPTLFRVVPAHEAAFVTRLLGRPRASLSGLAVTARVRGDVLVGEHVSAVLGGERLQVDLAFSAVGEAAPVRVPPARRAAPAG